MKTIFNALILTLIFYVSVQAQERPNILLFTIDDLNNDLGAYGHYIVKSPNIDKLAQKGVLFDKAYNQAPICTPSRSSFMTGLYPDQTGIIAHGSHTRMTPHFRDNIPNVTTLPQMFKNQGYFSGRVGKIYHQGVPGQIGTAGADDPASWDETSNPIGIDKLDETGIKSYNQNALDNLSYGGVLSWQSVISADTDHTDGKIASEAIDMIKRNHPGKTGKPFFMGVGFYRPHTPFVAPKRYYDLYDLDSIKPYIMPKNDRDDIPGIALTDRPEQRKLTIEQRKNIIQGYYASISFMDAQVGRVIDSLEEMDLADNTIIVFISDHGYQLGQHDLWQKGDLFEGSARVPMIIYAPKKASGVATSPVELVDIYPTLAKLSGLTPPEYLPGKDLSSMLDDPMVAVRDNAYSNTLSRVKGESGQYAYRKIRGHSIRTQRYRYTEYGDGIMGAELYDYQNDPEELKNLADQTSLEAIRINLKWKLDDRIKEATTRIREIE
ncbi:MAG: sulfatase [Kordiimonadaceae bacterium]|jgi:iduronate 2-sulfatase|nr:sulfatase [Kordiimonadaceae bacterium]MBT6031402.1 sulfatase [Kordiimonadaceae bacterium]